MPNLATGTMIGHHLPNIAALNVRKIGLFNVKNKVGKVAFEMDACA